MATSKDWVDTFTDRWDRQAHDLERAADRSKETTAIEKRLQHMRARTLRGCAQELRIENNKLVNSGR